MRQGNWSPSSAGRPCRLVRSAGVLRFRSSANINNGRLPHSMAAACLWLVLLLHLVAPALSAKGLNPSGSEPEFLEPLQNLTVTAGREVKLQCVVKHLGSYKVAWIHLERSAILTVQNHVITRNPRISVTHDQHHTWNLHISNVQESDRGGYMCQINTAVARTRTGYLAVVVPPSIDDAVSSSDVTVREHNAVTLTCNATGSPPLTVRWRREDGLLININRTYAVPEWDGTQLMLNRASRLDMAAYLCIASNGVPPTVSKRIPLAVEFAPTVSVPHQLVGAPLGSSVTLDCHLESSPSALHFWSREGGTVLHNATKYRMLTVPAGSASAYRTHLKLTIVSVTDADYGPYRCVAKNPFGEADGVIKLYHTPTITSTVAYTQVLQQLSSPVAPIMAHDRADDVMQDANNETKQKLKAHPNTFASSGKVRISEDLVHDTTTADKDHLNSKSSRSNTNWKFSWENAASSGSPKAVVRSVTVIVSMLSIYMSTLSSQTTLMY